MIGPRNASTLIVNDHPVTGLERSRLAAAGSLGAVF